MKSLTINEAVSLLRDRMASFLGYSHGGARDLYAAFGYSRQVDVRTLFETYQRNAVASRIVRAFPQATWRDQPNIGDEAGDSCERGTEGYSPFVEAAEKFFADFRILRILERVDRLASIGRFGILAMGFNDGLAPDKPMTNRKARLLWMSPYSEVSVTVSRWDMDPQSPRFGMPELYSIKGSDPTSLAGASLPTKSLTIHHTRTLHISEFLDQDEVYGTPRLLPILNNLMDLEKTVGGAAETFWLTANRGLALWADKELTLSAEMIDRMKDQAEEFSHQLRRSIVGQGMTAQVLGSEDPDPGPNATVLLDLISGGAGVPKRILLGTERGELASTQDENNWAERIRERRVNFATPSILVPFLRKMIDTGNIPEPQGEFYVEWPDAEALGPSAAADLAIKKTSALTAYANSPDAQLIMPVQEFRRDILGVEPESDYALVPVVDIPEDPQPALATNIAPRTLYLSRKVVNDKAIRKWAKSQGIKNLVKDLHVTIAYSKKPIDWMKLDSNVWSQDEEGQMLIPVGGARVVEPLGSATAVLLFSSDALTHRHSEVISAGGSYDYTQYQPHVTLTYEDCDLSKVKPYSGPIVLGPEVFAEIDPPNEEDR